MTTNDDMFTLILRLIWSGCRGEVNDMRLEESILNDTFTANVDELKSMFPGLDRGQATSLAVIAAMFISVDKTNEKTPPLSRGGSPDPPRT